MSKTHSATLPPTPPLTATSTSLPSPAYLDHFISSIASAFRTTAITTAIICEKDSVPSPYNSKPPSNPPSLPPPPIPSLSSSNNSNTRTTSPITHTRLTQHFASQIHDSVSNPLSHAHQNAILTEAGNWAAVACWEPPLYKTKSSPPSPPPPSPSISSHSQTTSNPTPNPKLGPVLSEWKNAMARMRAQYVGHVVAAAAESGTLNSLPGLSTGSSAERQTTTEDEEEEEEEEEEDDDDEGGRLNQRLNPHYHLAFLARRPGRDDVKGAVSAVVLPFLARARDEGVPVWLEATNPHAVAVYEHYGFRVCEEVTVGVGRVGADGWPTEAGEGVKTWGMLWDGKNIEGSKREPR